MKTNRLYSGNKFFGCIAVSRFALPFLSGLVIGSSLMANSMEKPNIVLILADDMGYECLGCNGSTSYQTPVLDNLARNGIRFEHCYSQPLCTPSRVKIMTGQYNYRNYEYFGYLNPVQKTFGNLLKEAGYATCIAGKWQLNGVNHKNEGWKDPDRPYAFGFDEYCLWQMNHEGKDGERYANPLITQNGKDLPRDENAYGPDIFSDYILDFIDRKAGKPFFIYYPMVLVHDPFVPTPDSPEWKDKSRRYEKDTTYFSDMVAYLDKDVGRIIKKLKDKKLFENTLFIFTGDNGTNVNIVSNTTKGKVKGGKGHSINTGNHVPLLVSWPSLIKKGSVCNQLVDFSDFLPTFAEAAGVSCNGYKVDGSSFMRLIRGEQREKDQVFIHYSPRWGKFESNRWVMNSEYKLYRDGRFFQTSTDTLEGKPLLQLSDRESRLKSQFQKILDERETEFPFEWNNTAFKPGK